MSKAARFLSLLLVACLLGGCGLLVPVEPQGTNAEVEEYVVYSDLIRAEYGSHGMVVIKDTTGMDMVGPLSALERAGPEFNTLQPSTRDSFAARNEGEYALIAGRFALTMPVVLISAAQTGEFFGEGGTGWDGFYERHPEAQGILRLSRVGFNATMDQALVYAGNKAYRLAGEGWLFLLEKHDGRWEIANRLMLWIS